MTEAKPDQLTAAVEHIAESLERIADSLELLFASQSEAGEQARHVIVSKRLTGRGQRNTLRALRNRRAEANGTLVWTLEDLRRIGRDLGQHKSTARSAVEGLVRNGFLTPTVGGYRLADGAQ